MAPAQDLILVCGGTGLLGPYLVSAARCLGTVVTCAGTSGEIRCDLNNPVAVADMLGDIRPTAVFHCVALTDVDACERDPDAADALNRGTVANLVSRLPADASIIYFSTDQVYSGEAGPYPEDAEAPVNVYGETKLAGEKAALAHPNSLVLRVNFFGPSMTKERASLSDWMIGAFRQRSPMTLFADSLFSPLHLSTLTELAVEAFARRLQGVFNLGSRDGMSKLDFGLEIARRFGFNTDNVVAGSSSGLAGRAPRPKDMRMAVDRIEHALCRNMPALSEEIWLLEAEPRGIVR